MTNTQAYYEMVQRNTQPFSKYPNKDANKEGITDEENAHMFRVAKDHQGMIKDLAEAQKRFGKRK